MTFVHHVGLAAPLFVLVLAGYLLMRGCGWPQSMSENLSRFVFSVALPAMLFRMMSDFSKLPPVDARLLVAFFGGCLIVFVIGRLLAWRLFALDGVGQSVFALVACSRTMCCSACRWPRSLSARRRFRRWPWCWCSTP
jgi:malonate transporter